MIGEDRIQIAMHKADSVFGTRLTLTYECQAYLVMEIRPGRRKGDAPSARTIEWLLKTIRAVWFDKRTHILEAHITQPCVKFEVHDEAPSVGELNRVTGPDSPIIPTFRPSDPAVLRNDPRLGDSPIK